jgi:L-asparaginase II
MIFYFSLNVSFQEFERYYQGHVSKVEVHDQNGKTLWINGRHFRPFLTRSGIKGQFKMELTSAGDLLSLTSISLI